MAVSKGKSLPVSPQPKSALYQKLFNLHQSFETIAVELESMDDREISAHTLKLHRAMAEELRSGVNHSLVSVLRDREERDWEEHGKRVRDLQSEEE